MYYSIAVYPRKENEAGGGAWRGYVDCAAQEGFDEVFLSLHLPEYSIAEQMKLLEQAAGAACQHGMRLTADVGGRQLTELLESEACSARIRRCRIGFIRLDYGFSMEQVTRMWKRWQVKGFTINASVYCRGEFVRLKKEFAGIDPAIALRACHNYYPRPESGLSYEFFVEQNAILAELGIPVCSCIPDRESARGPVYEGLPTVEAHRYLPLEQVVRRLAASPANEGFLAADEHFSREKLALIRRVAEEERKKTDRWTLRLRMETAVSEEERGIAFGQSHRIRYDSNDRLLRSLSSRQVSEYAERIAPRPACPRPRGTVTVDNSAYGRYSGELEIALTDLPADVRVNVIGRIAEDDLWKLAYYRYGAEYRFQEVF